MANEHPIRLALLWHMHQPDYRLHDHVLLPWTRLHAIKDYGEMIRILQRHPGMKCTVNFVPSLLRQIEGYAGEGWTDEVRELLRCPADKLSKREVERLVYWASLLPRRRLVAPFPGFERLLNRALSDSRALEVQEILDLQVWYMLAWTGEVAKESLQFELPVSEEEHFAEEDRISLSEQHDQIVKDLPAYLKKTASSDQIEFSTTPWYHPILPLLLDVDDASRSQPGVTLPEVETGWEEDVVHHLAGARRIHESWFGNRPVGCWPSEGSLSTRTLDRLIDAGFEWTAGDEFLLYRTLSEGHGTTDHCFPWSYRREDDEISIFFRDHDLSDRIGFVYAAMDAADAVDDFIEGILDRRERVIEEHGEEGIEEAVVVVILDGENCWEWYRDNGLPFLDELYSRLVAHPLITPVTMSEAADPVSPHRSLDDIVPGSWIGGNFRIWIGGEDDNRAWELLADAREQLMNHKGRIPEKSFYSAWEQILAAEGSDWFWWYSSENSSVNDPDFDALFRHRLQEVYRILGMEPPAELDHPLDHVGTGRGRSDSGEPTMMHRATFEDEGQDE